MTVAKLARQLNLRAGARGLPPLILVTDSRRLADPLPAAAALPRGSAVLLRHYEAPARATLARELARLCRRRGLRLLVAGDGALAARVRADGLHLTEALTRGAAHRAWAWRRRRPGWLITAAAHSTPALFAARRRGADAALLSPVFPTASHPGARALGPLRFAARARRSPLPVYALGGITAPGARRLGASGAVGVAALGALVPRRRRESRNVLKAEAHPL